MIEFSACIRLSAKYFNTHFRSEHRSYFSSSLVSPRWWTYSISLHILTRRQYLHIVYTPLISLQNVQPSLEAFH